MEGLEIGTEGETGVGAVRETGGGTDWSTRLGFANPMRAQVQKAAANCHR
jgi:hypothetical protein